MCIVIIVGFVHKSVHLTFSEIEIYFSNDDYFVFIFSKEWVSTNLDFIFHEWIPPWPPD